MSDSLSKVLIAGEWRASQGTEFIQAENPLTGEKLPEKFPVSTKQETLAAVEAAVTAADALRDVDPEAIARFLESFAAGIEVRAPDLVEMAHAETGLPKAPRLKDVELPRTTDQLRQAAKAARDGAWQRPVRDEARKIYSIFGPLGGPVVVMGPNNFPYAYNSAAGGDFAAAIVARNPIIAKANPGHPGTTRLFAEIANTAVRTCGLPPATVQLIYQTSLDTGFALVAHPSVGATAFTGSKESGLKLKEAADRAGRPIYLEMSSINPVVLLQGALEERAEGIADEFFGSCTAAAGQMCTNPGLIILPEGEAGRKFAETARGKFEAAQPGALLGSGVLKRLAQSVELLRQNGAEIICGGKALPGPAARYANTLLQISAAKFLNHPQELQTEAFGPASLLVWCANAAEIVAVVKSTGGNLTGSVYSRADGADDKDYAAVAPLLRTRAGRLLNDKMPTGVAVSPAMNHGGPYPSTGHPGFTAVGMPAAIQRFTALHCYDNVAARRLPAILSSSK